MNKEAVKTILNSEFKGSIHRARFCMVSDEDLESVIRGRELLENPKMYRAMQMRCQANNGRGLHIEKIILEENLISTPEEEFKMLRDYYKVEVIKKAEEKLEKLKLNLGEKL